MLRFFCGTAAEVIGWESLDGSTFKKAWNDSTSKWVQEAYHAKVTEAKSGISNMLKDYEERKMMKYKFTIHYSQLTFTIDHS
jgi:hypothetical protein